MTIEHWVDETPGTSLSTMSIWVGLRDDQSGEVRRFEAPNVLNTEDPQTYIDTNYTPDEMWAAGTTIDVMDEARERAIVKALMAVVLDEINLLRAEHSLSPRSKQQLVGAVKAHLKDA
jgi:hypothetical protein